MGAARGSRGGGEIEIAWLNPNRYPEAAARRLRPWLAALLAELAPAGCRSLGVRFAGDRGLRRANRDFRGKDQPTDVLSFPGGCGPGAAETRDAPAGGAGAATGRPGEADGHLGDVLISVPAARRQAAAAGHDTASELQVLLLHGVLHCLGYDHEADAGEMERLERRLRRRWIGSPAAPARPGGGRDRGNQPGGRAWPGGSARPARPGREGRRAG